MRRFCVTLWDYEDDTNHASISVVDRSGAIFNRVLLPPLMISAVCFASLTDRPFSQHALHRIFGRLSRVFIDKTKNNQQRQTDGFLALPPCQLFRFWIDKRHGTMVVGGNDGIANAGQGGLETIRAGRGSLVQESGGV